MKRLLAFLSLLFVSCHPVMAQSNKCSVNTPQVFNMLFITDSHGGFYEPHAEEGMVVWENRFGILISKVLNAQAEMEGVSFRFGSDVYAVPASDSSRLIYPFAVVPERLKTEKIDMVFFVASPDSFNGDFGLWRIWYYNPIVDGIPTFRPDNEYLLKPIKERMTGDAKKFFERCEKIGIARYNGVGVQFDHIDLILKDHEASVLLMHLIGEPLKKAREALAPNTKLVVMFLPKANSDSADNQRPFWMAVSVYAGVSFLDLAPQYNAYRNIFKGARFSECSGLDHLTLSGHQHTTYWLADALKKSGLIPW